MHVREDFLIQPKMLQVFFKCDKRAIFREKLSHLKSLS